MVDGTDPAPEPMTLGRFVAMVTKANELNPWMFDAPLYVSGGGDVSGYGAGSGRPGIAIVHDYYPKHSERSAWPTFEAMFKLARIEILGHWELANEYWPRSYSDLVLSNPWWLVKTHAGLVKIGWRKRVINIDWSDTQIRQVLTDDRVTKEPHLVHAATEEKAIEYLKALAVAIASETAVPA